MKFFIPHATLLKANQKIVPAVQNRPYMILEMIREAKIKN